MIITIAASALAIQLNIMPVRVAQPLVQPVQYGVSRAAVRRAATAGM